MLPRVMPSLVSAARHGLLGDRLRAVGVTLLCCSADGAVACQSAPGAGAPGASAGDRVDEGDGRDAAGLEWFGKLLLGSPLFMSMLKRSCAAWMAQGEPMAVELTPGLPGVWLLPLAVRSRRMVTGFGVGVIATREVMQSEGLAALCQASGADVQLIRGRLAGLRHPLPEAGEVPRLCAMIRAMEADLARLDASGSDLESVGRQLAESYEEISLLYTITQNMTVRERPERFVMAACQELLKTLPYAWMGVQFADDRERLKSLAGRLVTTGASAAPAAALRGATRQLLQHAAPDVPLVIGATGQPAIDGLCVLGRPSVAQPVVVDGVILGVLIAAEKRASGVQAGDAAGGHDAVSADSLAASPGSCSVTSVDMKLLAATATHMAIFLENAALYESLNAMFLGTLEALTASIDAKDRYTCGHSRRVAHLTAQLAAAIGLDDHAVGRMHIAGLVHDVGKIGVPEAVLLKPGRLNADEYAWIRQHPEMGYRILKDIPQLDDVLPGVLHHHERWDGKGYPEGLAGEAIPLVARLIGLADSFDAMSSTRTYRSALSRRQVLDEITKCVGTQFDPALASVFVKLDFSEFDRMVREHRAIEVDRPHQREAAA